MAGPPEFGQEHCLEREVRLDGLQRCLQTNTSVILLKYLPTWTGSILSYFKTDSYLEVKYATNTYLQIC